MLLIKLAIGDVSHEPAQLGSLVSTIAVCINLMWNIAKDSNKNLDIKPLLKNGLLLFQAK